MPAHDPSWLPPDLPRPADDGGADHLRGRALPPMALPATDGREIRFDDPRSAPRTIVYAYPRTGRPDHPPIDDWDLIPGARGCTPQACGFRDHHAELAAAGAEVFGLSTQDIAYQREAADRLHLPFPLVSDAELRFAQTLGLPTFMAAGQTLLRRLTLVVFGRARLLSRVSARRARPAGARLASSHCRPRGAASLTQSDLVIERLDARQLEQRGCSTPVPRAARSGGGA